MPAYTLVPASAGTPGVPRRGCPPSPLASLLAAAMLGLFGEPAVRAADEVALSPSATVWQTVTLTLRGPNARETDNDPNPFLDVRLQVAFTGPSGKSYVVPGFFDGPGGGDGDQDDPEVAGGNLWRVRFTPDEAGTWRYRVSFRRGSQVAIHLEPDAGTPVSPDGATGLFEVAPRKPSAPGFLKWGRLEYVGGHYLKFRDGPYWIRSGTDSPENFLAYAGFDNTPPSHRYASHVADWRPGDPDWGDGRARGIIGALNSLAAQGANSVYCLTMNIGGDGRDVWPWSGIPNPKGAATNDNLHFDVSKLRQWEQVFSHAQRQGLFLHLVLNEAEAANKRELDDGELGPERRLYYRELIARFAHHLALEWNLCEEFNLDFDLGPERIRAFADYLRAVDPYDHPISVHSAGDPLQALAFTWGDPRFSLTSVQLNQRPIHEVTEALRRATAIAGRPLPVSLDEFTVDRGQAASHVPVDDAAGHRREKLWPALFSGGMVEFILQDLLSTEDFHTPQRTALWRYAAIARRFMEDHLPFWEMQPADDLLRGGARIAVGTGGGRRTALGPQVLAKTGDCYAVYLPRGANGGTLDLSPLQGQAEQRWFDPRLGRFQGPSRALLGGGPVTLGPPPARPDEDWVVLIQKRERIPPRASHFPGAHWDRRDPVEVELDPLKLEDFASRVGGDGCIVREGYLVKAWGDITSHHHWASASKPVLSTLLLFAVQEHRLPSADARVADLGWSLSAKDAPMTFRHLANMTSGYALGEAPGTAWAYNDFAIQLYALSLTNVFGTTLDQALRERLSSLQFEDGEWFGSRQGLRVTASVRDFARLGWFWLNRGEWDGQTLLSPSLFEDCIRPGVPSTLPRTRARGQDDLGIGSYGGGPDQTPYGPGVYGFNFWFNERLATGAYVWPAAPPDTFQANGMWNRDTVTVFPGLRMVVAVRGAHAGEFAPGDADGTYNRDLRLLVEAARPDPLRSR